MHANLHDAIPTQAPTDLPTPGAFKLPVGTPGERDPRALDEHPLLRRLFDLCSDEANQELLESVAGRQYRPVLITGTNCASPPDTVLDGRRLRRAALKLNVPIAVEVIDGLTAEMEARVMIHSNVASGLARRYDERAKADLENYYIQTFGKRQGQRTDLTSVQSHRSDQRETAQIVADMMREEFGDDDVTPTAVRERQLIFHDPVSPEVLKRAVTEGTIARRPAADLLRKAKKDPEVTAALRELAEGKASPDVVAAHPVISAARSKLLAETQKLRGKDPKRTPAPRPAINTEAQGPLVAGVAALPNFLGKKVLLEVDVDAGSVHLSSLGPADVDPKVYVPDAPTTRITWPVDVAAVVAELPDELRAGVTVSPVEVLDPVKCPQCSGTRFYERCGCVRCTPALWRPDFAAIHAQVEREVAELVGPAHWDIYQHVHGVPETERRPLTDEERGTNRIIANVGNLVDERRRQARKLAQDEVRERDPLGLGYRGEVRDLRHPRSRIRISTPTGDLHVALWERERDWRPHGAHPEAACVVVPGRSVPIYLCADAWSTRSHLRAAVHQALMPLLPTDASDACVAGSGSVVVPSGGGDDNVSAVPGGCAEGGE